MASKQDYLDLLAEYELSEKDVSPIFRPELWSDKTAASIISLRNRLRPDIFSQYDDMRRAITSPSPFAFLDFILKIGRQHEAEKRFEQMESGDANLVISAIAWDLKRRLNVTPDVPVYHGVFPTRVFNAQAIKHGPGYLVLVESATLEIIEIVATLATLPSSLQSTVIHGVTDICRSYHQRLGHKVSDRYSPRPVEEYQRELSVSAQTYEASVALTSATEEFAIAHEWGHIVLGHALIGTTCAFDSWESSGHLDDETRTNAREDEFAADLWSIGMLMESAKTPERFQRTVEGAFLFLSLARQFEGYEDADRLKIGTHPTATERLWMISRLANRYIRYKRSYLQSAAAGTVRAILDGCHKSEFGRPPPDMASSEPTLSALYTKFIPLIFPYDKNLW